MLEKVKIRWVALACVMLLLSWVVIPKPPMTMAVVRVADYRESVCDGSERRYVEKLDDTYRFSRILSEYSLSADVQRKYGLDLQVTDRTTELRLRHVDECPDCVLGKYTYPQALQVRHRVARVLWKWTSDQAIEPTGVAYKGRYPVTRVEFVVIPPEGLDVLPNWSSSPRETVTCKQTADIADVRSPFSRLREFLGWQPNDHAFHAGEAKETLQLADKMRIVCTPKRARDLITDTIDLNYTISGWPECSVPEITRKRS